MESVKKLIEQANSRVGTVSVQKALSLVGDSGTALVDLRDSAELQHDGKRIVYAVLVQNQVTQMIQVLVAIHADHYSELQP